MTFRLINDRVAVLADEESDTTESGLIIAPEQTGERLRYGTVAVVGLGRKSDQPPHGHINPPFTEGDRVFFNRFSGSDITVEGTEYKFLDASEIIGIVE